MNEIIKKRGRYLVATQQKISHGYENLDAVGIESFINHMHLWGKNRNKQCQEIIQDWIFQFISKWPQETFRIYRHFDKNEITIRFHAQRTTCPNWSEDTNGLIIVSGFPKKDAKIMKK